jgi:sugar lactone lactonase YvrE
MATLLVGVLVSAAPASAQRGRPGGEPVVTELATFGSGLGSGSTIGPDGALYVTDGNAGAVLRIDPETAATSMFAHGMPVQIAGIGGAIDVAFLGRTAYVLVTLVGPFFGQNDVIDGIYRVNRDGTATPIADIGAWSIAHPPNTVFAITTGVQYAMQPYRNGFLVTDGHHNRVLRVTRNGDISEFKTFGDIVPTGLERSGHTIYMAEAGPVPHVPATGKVVSIGRRGAVNDVASGASLLVDVEFGPGHQLYALSQGYWDLPNDPANAGAPASHNTGELVKVAHGGTLTPVVGGLDQPTSLEFIGNTAYVVTLTGTVMKITNVAGQSSGHSH